MKQIMKQKSIGQIIALALCMISIFLLSTIWIRFSIVTSTQIVGKQQNFNLAEEESVKIGMRQDIEKYFNVDNNQALLQQKIEIATNRSDINKEYERLQLDVPVIQEQRPKLAILLVNGNPVNDQFYTYDVQTGKIEIELPMNKNIANTYKIIYGYDEINVEEEQSILLNTTVYTKIENLEEIETHDSRNIEIAKMGEKVSIQGEITKEVYKGYLYQARGNEIAYHENYIIEVSNFQGVEEINIGNEEAQYTYYQEQIDTQTEEVIESRRMAASVNDNIYFKKTEINQDSIKRLLGEEGKIILKNQNDEIIQEITKDTPVDENGNIVIEYTNNEVKNIKMTLSKPEQVGTLKINHSKAIGSNTGYEKEVLNKIQFLEEKVVANDSSADFKMALLDTKTEAKIEINNANLSTLEANDNIQITATLLSSFQEQDLYKDPIVQLVFPKEVKEIEINAINLLYTEELKIETAVLKDNEYGNKVIEIQLVGEQTQYASNINQGICITVDGSILLDSLASSNNSELILSYTNGNKPGEQWEERCPVTINSKQGVLTYSRADGFKDNEEGVETLSDEIAEAKLDVYSGAKQTTISTAIVNNYEQPIENVVIMGRIPTQGNSEIKGEERNSNLSMNLLGNININESDAEIYYSQDSNAQVDSDSWTQEPEDYTTVKSYKIVANNNTIQPKEKLAMSYSLYLPENIEYNAVAYNNYVVSYAIEDKQLENTSTVSFKTEERQEEQQEEQQEEKEEIQQEQQQEISFMENAEGKEEYVEGIGKISIVAISGEQIIKDGQEVSEGQNIKYKIAVTNTNQETVNNIKIVAKNTNAIYYGEVKYRTVDTDEDDPNAYNYYDEEDEKLTQKDLEIESLKSGETAILEYEISVKEVKEGEKTVGTMEIKADNVETKNIKTFTNSVKQSDLKIVLKDRLTKRNQISSRSNLLIGIIVYNLSNVKQENIILETKLPIELSLNQKELYLEKGFELVSYDKESNVVKLKINQLEQGNSLETGIRVYINDLGGNKTINSSFFFTATTQNKNDYISNTIQRTVTQEDSIVVGKQVTNIETGEVERGQKVEYTTTIQNVGEIDELIMLKTQIELGQTVDEIYYIYNGEKIIIHEEDIQNRVVNLKNNLNQGEELVFVEKLIVNTDYNAGEITNHIEVYTQKSKVEINDITLVLKNYQEPGNPDNPDPNNPNQGDSNQNNPNQNDQNENNSNKNDGGQESKYTIGGVAWIDQNKNGKRETTENTLNGIEVSLIDENNNVIQETKTNQSGSYQFDQLKNGRYIVIFQYDSDQYRVTDYQKDGVSQANNSDVITKKISLKGENKTVAMTDSIQIQNTSQANIDAGFIKNEKFDMAFAKTISQIVVNTRQGSTVYNYNDVTLSKVEVHAKYLEGATVKIVYHIKVTNQGELAGYVNDIVDNCPDNVTFTEADNKGWTKGQDGKLHYIALSNQIIQPGETKIVDLILTKKMNSNNTGTIKNTAEINETSNKSNIKDADSSNNMGSAEVIVSVRTGKVILYIAFIIGLLGVIVVSIPYIKKTIKK